MEVHFIKNILILIILSIPLLLIISCNNGRRDERRNEFMIDENRLLFAHNTHMFDLRIVVDGTIYESSDECQMAIIHVHRMITNPSHPDFNPFYDELIFVRNRDEAQGFTDNVIVAWPSGSNGMIRSLGRLNRFINLTIDEIPWYGDEPERQPINLEDFGLIYPIDMEDITENAEQVLAVFEMLLQGERERVR